VCVEGNAIVEQWTTPDGQQRSGLKIWQSAWQGADEGVHRCAAHPCVFFFLSFLSGFYNRPPLTMSRGCARAANFEVLKRPARDEQQGEDGGEESYGR
jgi:hypothetical protein